jgi:hypothetical protein
MTFNTLGNLGALGLGGSARPAWAVHGALVDLWIEKGLYWALKRRYPVDTLPGLDAYAFENFEATSIKGLATVTRAGVATDGAGVSVAANMPRIGTNGILVEEARTNKCTVWVNPTATTNLATGGDAAGTISVVTDTTELANAGLLGLTGDAVYKADNSGGSGSYYVAVGGQPGNTNAHSLSVYARVSSGTAGMQYAGGGSDVTISNSTYERILSENATPDLSTRKLQFEVDAASVLYFCLPQLEEGAFATSYIPTAGAPVTRPADDVTIPTSLFDFSTTAGTVFVEADIPQDDDGTYNRVLSFNDGSTDNAIDIVSGSANSLGMYHRSAASTGVDLSAGTYSKTATNKIAHAWALNDAAASLNGASAATDGAFNVAVGVTTLMLGKRFGQGEFNGSIRKVFYYNSRLTNAQIEGMTAGTIDPATLSPVLSLDFINRTYSRGGDPFAETVLSDDFTGYGSQAEAESAGWVFSQGGPGGWVFDAAGDKAKCDGNNTGAAVYLYKSVSGLIPGQAYVADVVSAVSGSWTSVYSTAAVTIALVAARTTSIGSNLFAFIAPADGEVSVAMGANAGDVDEVTSVTIKRVELYLTGVDSTLGLSATESFDLVYDDATTATQAAVGGELAILASNNPLARVSA